MNKLIIHGNRPLRGSLPVSGSKNTALALMAAAVMGHGVSTIRRIPNLRDVTTFSNVLRVTGAMVQFDAASKTLTVDASRVEHPESPYELVKQMRASFYMLGALLGRCGEARVSLPGGCAWGPRPVDLHIEGMKAFGAEIELDQGDVVARTPAGGLPGGSFRLEPSSVGATINLLLAAATARGGSRIENAAMEPDVVVFGEALRQMGARIHGLGTPTIEIEGVPSLSAIDFDNCSDRIELGTFMIAAAIAGEPGEVIRLPNANHEHLGEAFIQAFEETGTRVTYGNESVEVTVPDEIKPVSVETAIYPGFPTDLQAQWTVLLSQANGPASVTDHIYQDRFKHIPELQRMGLFASVVGNRVTVKGNGQLFGAKVMSTDLRGSVALVLAGLIATGRTEVLRIYHLDRGYEDLELKLSQAGADIQRERYEEFAESEAQTM
jgi:UDP-N-acetylglucosamine 1-carboxyvinyltransferase